MMDLAPELLRAAITTAILLFAFRTSRRFGLARDPGWRLISLGCALLVFATWWDAAESVESLPIHAIVNEPALEILFEDIVGYLGGFLLVFAGLLRWLPLAGETRAARAELARLNAELETRVAERTAELERVSEAKSGFLARMSHELRTPLNAITGFSDMIARQAAGPVGTARYVDYAGHIHASARHLLELIDEILDLARIEAGQMTLEETTVDPGVVAGRALCMVRPMAQEAGIELEERCDQGLPFVRADERRLRQVMLNLLSNAIKFTPKGGRVTLGLGMDRDGNPTITVRDTGIGMSAEELARVRRPFVQGRQLEERRSPGTGLGLVLVEQLVELHGGAFTMESMPGKGTTATVALPAERVMAAEREADRDVDRIAATGPVEASALAVRASA